MDPNNATAQKTVDDDPKARVFNLLRQLEELQERAGNAIDALPHRSSPSFEEVKARNSQKRAIQKSIAQYFDDDISKKDIGEIEKQVSQWKIYLQRFNN